MKYLLFWLSGFLPCRIISHTDAPYLERYYLFTLLGVRFYLHRFVGNDPGEYMHDHPWAWARSIVLSGWYFEESRAGIKKVKWCNRISGDFFHRIYLPEQDEKSELETRLAECWTLFFHKEKPIKPWGLLKPMEGTTAKLWIPHDYPKAGEWSGRAWWETAPIGKKCANRYGNNTEWEVV